MKTRAQILGENLERIRKEKGVTRKQLAAALGVSEKTIGNYANGEKEPSFEKLFSLADFLEVSVASIIGENDFADNVPNVDKKIFEYRLQRAYQIARDFLDSVANQKPNFDKEGRIVIYSPQKIQFDKNGVISYAGNYNSVTFKTAEDFVEVMERAENDALQRQVPINLAFRHIVFGDEFYRVID